MSQTSGFVLRPAVAALLCALTLLSNRVSLRAQSSTTNTTPTTTAQIPQDDLDRPVLKHRSEPIPETKQAAPTMQVAARPTGPVIAPGLALPATGRVWALDNFEGKPELVHLKYFPTNVDRHAGSNFAKVSLAPFIAKPKITIEIQGAKSAIRLHETTPVIFLRYTPRDNEDAAIDPSQNPTYTELTVVKLDVRKEKRIVSTMAFTQVTGTPSRSEEVIEIDKAQVANSEWQKITPRKPLAPGEYGLLALPKGQGLAPTRVFDFAIDPNAPRNQGVVLPSAGNTP